MVTKNELDEFGFDTLKSAGITVNKSAMDHIFADTLEDGIDKINAIIRIANRVKYAMNKSIEKRR